MIRWIGAIWIKDGKVVEKVLQREYLGSPEPSEHEHDTFLVRRGDDHEALQNWIDGYCQFTAISPIPMSMGACNVMMQHQDAMNNYVMAEAVLKALERSSKDHYEPAVTGDDMKTALRNVMGRVA